jgi:hypothetical protein
MGIDEDAAAVLRADQAKRLEAEAVALVKQYGLLLKMNRPVREFFVKLAQFNDFQQLAKEL